MLQLFMSLASLFKSQSWAPCTCGSNGQFTIQQVFLQAAVLQAFPVSKPAKLSLAEQREFRLDSNKGMDVTGDVILPHDAHDLL